MMRLQNESFHVIDKGVGHGLFSLTNPDDLNAPSVERRKSGDVLHYGLLGKNNLASVVPENGNNGAKRPQSKGIADKSAVVPDVPSRIRFENETHRIGSHGEGKLCIRQVTQPTNLYFHFAPLHPMSSRTFADTSGAAQKAEPINTAWAPACSMASTSARVLIALSPTK